MRAASMSVARSAIFHWIAWCWAMGLPNVLRCPAYATLSSRHARAMPSAWAAMPMRPPSSVDIATLNPPPTSPRTALAGTRTSSRKIWQLCDPRMPSFLSGGPSVTPFLSSGIRNDVIPRWPLSGSVIAISTATRAFGPLAIQFFVPEMTKSSPARAGARLLRAGGGPRLGLRQAEAAEEAPAPQRDQPLLLLRRRAELLDRIAHQRVVDAHDDAGRRAGARDLLHHQDVGDGVEAGAAVLLGDGHAEEPQLRHAAHQPRREAVLAVDRGRLRQHILHGELARRLQDELLLRREGEVHRHFPSNRAGRLARNACIPSRWSALSNSVANASASRRSASSSGSDCPRWITPLAAASASGGFSASLAARARMS